MKDAYKPVWMILFFAAGVAAVTGLARMRHGGGSADGPERVPWTTDFAAARTQSSETHKPILVYFTAKWCGPCQQMKGTTWADERVAAALSDCLPVKIDIDDQQDLASQFRVDAIPHVELLDTGGGRRLVSTGLVSPDEFLAKLRQARGQ